MYWFIFSSSAAVLSYVTEYTILKTLDSKPTVYI